VKKDFLAFGNTLKGDDGVTTYLGKLIEKEGLGWKIFYGQDTSENEFHNIKEYAPDIIVVADAIAGWKCRVNRYI